MIRHATNNEDRDGAEELPTGTVSVSLDGELEYTIHPEGVAEFEYTTTWISATAGSFVELSEWR